MHGNVQSSLLKSYAHQDWCSAWGGIHVQIWDAKVDACHVLALFPGAQ